MHPEVRINKAEAALALDCALQAGDLRFQSVARFSGSSHMVPRYRVQHQIDSGDLVPVLL
jgi:hypothetical protein